MVWSYGICIWINTCFLETIILACTKYTTVMGSCGFPKVIESYKNSDIGSEHDMILITPHDYIPVNQIFAT